MNVDEPAAVKRLLSRLPAGEMDPARSERVRSRCHAVLVRRQVTVAPPVLLRRSRRFVVELAIAGAFSLIYLSSVVFSAVQAGSLGITP